MTTGDKIKIECLKKGVTQKELSENIDYSYGSVRDAISKNKFSYKMLVKIEAKLGIDLESKKLLK